MRARRRLARLPLPLRHVLAGAVLLGAAGAVAGLIIGLVAYAPTAWFAAFELGIPATLAGSLVGRGSGCAAMGVRAARSSRAG